MELPPDDSTRWSSPGLFPDLSAGAVHVWRFALEVPPERFDRLSGLVSDKEQRQAAQFRTDELARRFIVRRARLRQLLGQYLHLQPEAIRFGQNEFGKPALIAPADQARIRFSTSHSGQFGLVAVAWELELGVDIERVRAMDDFDAMCRQCLAPAEREALERLEAEKRLPAFFRIWVCKEAMLKALGTGLSVDMKRVVVDFREAGPLTFQALDFDRERIRFPPWQLWELHPHPGYAGALAAPQQVVSLQCFCWP